MSLDLALGMSMSSAGFPDIPITIAGGSVPRLMMHQLSWFVRN
eukprot:CAMPEP_0167826622 /NCGR_PEP_ID=MMETSP0112_2-20121227/10153_1 /TAXON_ID=91324 /ORGANISM="Lotharella globosa, Strain CCCM811" /LENGTH=42 /DNA_ID= /DNA_START= /DNA_END= /DNA_ORIENTATION=